MNKVVKTGLTLLAGGSLGAGIGAGIARNIFLKSTNKKSEKIDKFKTYYNMLNQWLLLKQEGKSLEQYFVDNGYQTIAIYGMGELGNRLYKELEDSKIEIKYAIDKNAGSIYSELDLYDISEDLPNVDAIVVTAIFAFNDIEKEISSKDSYSYPVISLEDVLYEI